MPTVVSSPTVSATPPSTPVETATPEPTVIPAPASAAPAIGPVRNEGKAIIAELDATHGTKQLYYGESGNVAVVTLGSSYSLNGAPLTKASVACIDTIRRGELPTECREVRIIPPFPLINGATYTLAFIGEAVGVFVARGVELLTPHVVNVSATQHNLFVQFDRPMNHYGDCGGRATNFYVPGTIEHLFAATGPGFPPTLGAYRTSVPAYATALAMMTSGTIAPDCRAITFESPWGAAPGTYDLTIAGLEDEDGNTLGAAAFRVTVPPDDEPPSLVFAALKVRDGGVTHLRVAFSEAMDEESATDPERYLISGKPLPADASVECEFVGCVWVTLDVPTSFFEGGGPETITIVGVTDTIGRSMQPDTAMSRPFSP